MSSVLGRGRLERPIVALVAWSRRRAWLVLLGALIVSALASQRIPSLRIKSDLADLLPEHFPSILRLREIEKRLGTQADMIVTVESPSFEANAAFGEALAERIRGLHDMVGSVQFRRDRTYFEDHALMYVSIEDLQRLDERIATRVRQEVARSMDSALGLGDDDAADDDDDEPEDEFDRPAAAPAAQAPVPGPAEPPGAPADAVAAAPAEEEAPLGSEEDELEMDRLRERFREYDIDEYMRTEDGSLVLLKVRPLFPPTRMERAQALSEEIQRIVAELGPKRYHPELRVSYKGDYAEKQQEVKGLRSDIFSSALICVLVLMAVIALHFRSLRAVPLIIVPTVFGILWTLGFAQLSIGHLNIVSSFIFAILMGLGIDYGIHALARYEEERSLGKDAPTAMELALLHSGLSNLTAALTTVSVFLTLMLADFRGFSEFGFIAAVGIGFSIANVFLVFPAGVFALERVRPARYSAAPPSGTVERLGSWRPSNALVGFVLLASAAAAAYSLWAAPQLEFEYSFSKLSEKVRPVAPSEGASAPQGAKKEDRYLEAAGRIHDVAPAVVLTESLEETRLVYDTLRAILAVPDEDVAHPERWQGPLLAAVRERTPEPAVWLAYAKERIYDDITSIWRFVPEQQDDKLAIIARSKRRLDQKISLFQGKERERLDKLRHYLSTGPVRPEDFPEWVREQFRDRQGKLGRFVLFRARGAKADYRISSLLKERFWELRFGDKTFPVAATYFVLPEVVDTIREDGKLTVGLGLLAITGLLLLLFRRPSHVFVVLLPLLLGATSLAGFLFLFGMKLDYFNVVVIPLLLGMGVDNGIHLFSRLRDDGTERLMAILRHTGGAMFLTTLTTCIGFAGLWVANHRGLRNLGTTAIAGMALCLAASLFTLPALVLLVERLGKWRRARSAR